MADSDESTLVSPDEGKSEGDKNSWSQDNRKIDYLIDKYDLDGVILEMQSRWERDDDERWGIRKCGRYFNTQILESVFRNQVHDHPKNYSNEEIHNILTGDGDDVDSDARESVRNWFEERGADPDEIADDFVHFRTVFKYFKNELEAQSPNLESSPEERRAQIEKMVNQSLGKSEATIKSVLNRGQKAGVYPDTEFSLDFRVSIRCRECGSLLRLQDFLDNEGCDCDIK
jgi:hypothetical protein